MKANGKRQMAKVQEAPHPWANDHRQTTTESGFSLTELLIAMMVFTVIMGAVMTLVLKSQRIFTTEQNAAEVNQNGRLLIDFLTRDIQQSKENGLGLGARFRSVYSNNGIEGKTDEITIISSDTETKVPSKALPLIPASTRPFSTVDKYVELLPNSAANIEPREVIDSLKPNEEFIVSSVLSDGSVQFDFLKISSATLTQEGLIGLSFQPVEHRGIEAEIPFGRVYEGGAFTLRPVFIKRYYVDKSNQEHPSLSLSINDSAPITIASNVVAFQLRYLQTRAGAVDGEWVKQQYISSQYRTEAVEVTMTAKTNVASDKAAERLVTLATVIRPRDVPSGAFGSSNGTSSPGNPGEGDNGGNGGYGPGDGNGFPGDGSGSGGNGSGGRGNGSGNGFDNGNGGFQGGGYNHETRRIGKQPKLGERLNDNPFNNRERKP
ncbi:MAG: prepilin-type N-terminal cleavage/methylation domain-containing protein [Acidobacteria bacterium]|nr:prepilin-type N-terminal cleavage/methylation domain-containing protein [Acidobacteriota bacterium]